MKKIKLPPKSCPNCEYFKSKQYLDKNNNIKFKEYCQKFHQELFSHKACPKFHYNKDVDIETTSGNIAGFSGAVLLLCVLVFIISLFLKIKLIIWISGSIGLVSMISLMIFMFISNKVENKILYGKNEKEI